MGAVPGMEGMEGTDQGNIEAGRSKRGGKDAYLHVIIHSQYYIILDLS